MSIKDEFEQLMCRFEDAINQATDCLAMLCRKRLFRKHQRRKPKRITAPSSSSSNQLLADSQSKSTSLVSLRDIEFVHSEWEANEVIRANVPRCESRVIAIFG